MCWCRSAVGIAAMEKDVRDVVREGAMAAEAMSSDSEALRDVEADMVMQRTGGYVGGDIAAREGGQKDGSLSVVIERQIGRR